MADCPGGTWDHRAIPDARAEIILFLKRVRDDDDMIPPSLAVFSVRKSFASVGQALSSLCVYFVISSVPLGGQQPIPIAGVRHENTHTSARAFALGGVRVAGICQLVFESNLGHQSPHRLGP